MKHTPEEVCDDCISISLQTNKVKVYVHNVRTPPPPSHSGKNLAIID